MGIIRTLVVAYITIIYYPTIKKHIGYITGNSIGIGKSTSIVCTVMDIVSTWLIVSYTITVIVGLHIGMLMLQDIFNWMVVKLK